MADDLQRRHPNTISRSSAPTKPPAVANVLDECTFTDTGRRVRDEIVSRFRFRDGLIIEHLDPCDARASADQARGGIGGFVSGRLRFLRAWKARAKLRPFMAANTGQYVHGNEKTNAKRAG